MAQIMNATLGGEVLLNCIQNLNHTLIQDPWLYWQTEFSGGKNVHFYRYGEDDLKHQDPLYQNRTALDRSQVPTGNFSLLLSNLTEQDNNTSFHCLCSTEQDRATHRGTKLISQILLQLQEPLVPATAPEAAVFPPWAIWVLAILFVGLLGVILFVVRRRRRRRTVQMTGNGAGTANGSSNAATNGTANPTTDDSSATLMDSKV